MLPVASSSNKTPTHPYLWDSTTLNQMEGKICDNYFDIIIKQMLLYYNLYTNKKLYYYT